MTHVSVHFNAADPLLHACRLVRKGQRLGASLAVVATSELLEHFDTLLWRFDATSFVPHLRVRANDTVQSDPRMPWTSVWLVEHADASPHHEVLVNLGNEVPPGFERYQRLIDVVGSEAPLREAGRQRWKHYVARGYEINRVDLAE